MQNQTNPQSDPDKPEHAVSKPPPRNALRRFIAYRMRMLLACLLGVLVGLLWPLEGKAVARTLLGWDVAIYAYIIMILAMSWRANHQRVSRLAQLQDESAALVLTVVCIGAIMSLVAVVMELSAAGHDASNALRATRLVLTGLTVFGSWALIPTLFAVHYAHLFYNSPKDQRPLSFPEGDFNPDYWDFLYFSFTIAVASQTADISLRTPHFRKLVLAQEILSFLFNASILGFTVNIAASLVAN